MAAKDRVGRVFGVAVGVIADGGKNRIGVVAGRIALGQAAQPPRPAGVGRDLPRAALHLGDRGLSGQHGHLVFNSRRRKTRTAPLQIGHCPPHAVLRDLKAEIIPRLKQNTLSFGCGRPQPLPHGTVGRLAEIPALGVLEMGFAGGQRDFYIGQRRARQHADMAALGQVGQNQPLPVSVQRVRPAGGGKLHAAAALPRLKQQVNLSIVAQGLVMPHALNRCTERFFVEDAALPEADLQPEPAVQHTLQDFQLNFPHQLQVNLPQRIVPDNVKLGVLLLERAQRPQSVVGVGALRQLDPVVENRLKDGRAGVGLTAKAFAGVGAHQPGHGADRAGRGLTDEAEFAARIKPQLVGFLLKADAGIRPRVQKVLDLQHAACDFQVG